MLERAQTPSECFYRVVSGNTPTQPNNTDHVDGSDDNTVATTAIILIFVIFKTKQQKVNIAVLCLKSICKIIGFSLVVEV